DLILPGGVLRDIGDNGIAAIRREIKDLAAAIDALREIYIDHAGLQDRLVDCGRIRKDQAERLGLAGRAGRASGIVCDLRVQLPPAPYDELDVKMVVRSGGDVAARATVRVEEIIESLRLIALVLSRLPPGGLTVTLPAAPEFAFGLGCIEGWRGEV